MRVPVHRFCDLVLGWCYEQVAHEEGGREKLLNDLNAPLEGEARREPTPEELEAEYKAMMSFGASIGGA